MHISLRPVYRAPVRGYDDDSDDPITDGPLKGKTVRVDGWPAIACYVVADDGENEAVVVMVGDDQQHRVDRDDCTEIGDLDYCADCGQIGCGHDGRDRSEADNA